MNTILHVKGQVPHQVNILLTLPLTLLKERPQHPLAFWQECCVCWPGCGILIAAVNVEHWISLVWRLVRLLVYCLYWLLRKLLCLLSSGLTLTNFLQITNFITFMALCIFKLAGSGIMFRFTTMVAAMALKRIDCNFVNRVWTVNYDHPFANLSVPWHFLQQIPFLWTIPLLF